LAIGDTGTRRRGDDDKTHASPRLSASTHLSVSPRDGDAPLRDVETQPRDSTLLDQSPLSARNGARLSKILVGKSLIETLFVVALVVVFSYIHFNPRLRGTLDAADEREVVGWVVDESDPGRQVEVELYIDGHFVARRRADAPRPDVLAAGRAASAYHGYIFETPPLPARDAEYEARIFAVHEGADADRIGLQLVGKSLRFKVQPSVTSDGAREDWWEGAGKR
jgi:hypothetical protein